MTEREAILSALQELERHAPTEGGCGDPDCCGTYAEMTQDNHGEWLSRVEVLAVLEAKKDQNHNG